MERKIGEVFEHEGVKLEVVRCFSCEGCHFDTGEFGLCGDDLPEDFSKCTSFDRSDKTSVIFRKVEAQ